jgi:hypothetical protein
MNYLRVSFFVSLAALVATAFAQTPPTAGQAPARSRIAGTVAAVDAPASRISVTTDKGDAVTVSAAANTLIIRVPAGETDVRKGSKIAIADVAPGDRIVAIGAQPDAASMEARSILVMSKADVAQIRQKERADWQARGVTGTVTAIDPAANTFTLKEAQRVVTVTPTAKTVYRRYSPDSARFADAKPGSFAEIHTGDQARVLGDKSGDGGTIRAEQIVFGTFRQIAATVTSVNAATGELLVKDLATKKPLTVRVNSDTTLRKLPEMMAQMLATRFRSGNAGAPGGESARGGRKGEGPGEANRAGWAGRGGHGDVGTMLDRLPPLPLAELKPGDAIMVSTTAGTDPERVTAVTLLAGVEPLLRASPTATRDLLSGWNLGSGGDAENLGGNAQ